MTARLMTLAVTFTHPGRLAVCVAVIILGCAFLFRSAGKPALNFVLLLGGVVVIKEVLSRFAGPVAEYVFTGVALAGVIFFYNVRRRKMAQQRGGHQNVKPDGEKDAF
jgi:hypothetical protein